MCTYVVSTFINWNMTVNSVFWEYIIMNTVPLGQCIWLARSVYCYFNFFLADILPRWLSHQLFMMFVFLAWVHYMNGLWEGNIYEYRINISCFWMTLIWFISAHLLYMKHRFKFYSFRRNISSYRKLICYKI